MKNAESTGLMEKRIFLESSVTVILAVADLISRRLVDSIVRDDIKKLMSLPPSTKQLLANQGVARIAKLQPEALRILTTHLDESYITLAYSWLEAYLSIVEEALYLSDPQSLGDNIQIKLGKILEANSIQELVHDSVKKRLKEKSGWGLKNRILDLKQTYGVDVGYSDQALENISRTRNELVHEKRVGDFSVTGKQVKFNPRQHRNRRINADEYLDVMVNLIVELFLQTSKALRIDARSSRFKSLKASCQGVRNAFKDGATQNTEA
jgi:hypothetical protein